MTLLPVNLVMLRLTVNNTSSKSDFRYSLCLDESADLMGLRIWWVRRSAGFDRYGLQFQVLPLYHAMPVESRRHINAVIHISNFGVAMPMCKFIYINCEVSLCHKCSTAPGDRTTTIRVRFSLIPIVYASVACHQCLLL